MKSYFIPAGPIRVEQNVKRSLFICYIAHCATPAEADDFIRQISEKHKDANHNCWARIAGSPSDPAGYGMNDDGDPRGCAGKPMFNVLHHSGLGEICVVVSRYFGGIKLGTGGMARAYSSTVQLALDELQTVEKVEYSRINLVLPYTLVKTVEHLVKAENGRITDSSYEVDIKLKLEIPQERAEDFHKKICEAGQGTILYTLL